MAPSPLGSLTLFLDFDGVTHPDRARPERQFEALPLIEKVLRDHPEVEVVLSTSWRESYPLDVLRYLFSIDISERIVGMNPIYSGDRPWPDFLFERAQKKGMLSARCGPLKTERLSIRGSPLTTDHGGSIPTAKTYMQLT